MLGKTISLICQYFATSAKSFKHITRKRGSFSSSMIQRFLRFAHLAFNMDIFDTYNNRFNSVYVTIDLGKEKCSNRPEKKHLDMK